MSVQNYGKLLQHCVVECSVRNSFGIIVRKTMLSYLSLTFVQGPYNFWQSSCEKSILLMDCCGGWVYIMYICIVVEWTSESCIIAVKVQNQQKSWLKMRCFCTGCWKALVWNTDGFFFVENDVLHIQWIFFMLSS